MNTPRYYVTKLGTEYVILDRLEHVPTVARYKHENSAMNHCERINKDLPEGIDPAMKQLQKLRRSANNPRGHKLQWERPVKYDHPGRLTQLGTCKVCGMWVQVDTLPPPNGIDVGGPACAEGCHNV